MTEPLYLTEQQVSDYLAEIGIPTAVGTLQNKRVKGGGIPFFKLGSKIRYRKKDIDAWLAGLKSVKSTSELSKQ